MIEGIVSAGMTATIVKIYHTENLAEIAKISAGYSKTGIGIGIQSKGMVRINHVNRDPVDSLEVSFNMPFSNWALYKEIGVNAVSYAKGEKPLKVSNRIKPGSLSNYELKMIKLSSEDSIFINRSKKPSVMIRVT